MITEVMTNHEIVFVLMAFIFTVGGFYTVQKKLPEMLRRSMEAVDTKIDKIDARMDSSDKSTQSMQIIQAKNEVKIDSIQNSQTEMKQSIARIYEILNRKGDPYDRARQE